MQECQKSLLRIVHILLALQEDSGVCAILEVLTSVISSSFRAEAWLFCCCCQILSYSPFQTATSLRSSRDSSVTLRILDKQAVFSFPSAIIFSESSYSSFLVMERRRAISPRYLCSLIQNCSISIFSSFIYLSRSKILLCKSLEGRSCSHRRLFRYIRLLLRFKVLLELAGEAVSFGLVILGVRRRKSILAFSFCSQTAITLRQQSRTVSNSFFSASSSSSDGISGNSSLNSPMTGPAGGFACCLRILNLSCSFQRTICSKCSSYHFKDINSLQFAQPIKINQYHQSLTNSHPRQQMRISPSFGMIVAPQKQDGISLGLAKKLNPSPASLLLLSSNTASFPSLEHRVSEERSPWVNLPLMRQRQSFSFSLNTLSYKF